MGLIKIVGAFVENDKDEILLVKEAKPDLGLVWKIPTGRLRVKENHHSGILREVKEETGYDIQVMEQVSHYFYPGIYGDRLERFDFYARLRGGKPAPKKGEILAINWVGLDFLSELRDSYKKTHVYNIQISAFLDYKARKR